jgi:DNA-binding HxlR family transcriptional regulator
MKTEVRTNLLVSEKNITIDDNACKYYNECNIHINCEVLFMKTKDELPACPVATTVSLIGNKWKLLILRNLLVRPWRFNELQKSLDGISQRVLTDSLRSMEADGIITRTVFPEVPPRVEYALSELGESMRPILKTMEDWGNSYKASFG